MVDNGIADAHHNLQCHDLPETAAHYELVVVESTLSKQDAA